ncbi:DNA ligase [Nesidiocoris tenuis]|uniref:DNA ligase n=1 Tax=Nesidiocoris tenuis TaxID=355587 RepID=A0ABN7AVJ1_9HEMI|nr:DNA ligase [Nesidiocoris tenuis]
MADGEASTQYRWFADRAKTGRAACKKCKQVIEAKSLRMAKAAPSPFGSGEQMMKAWHHLDCMFLVFSKQRATTAKIESVDDIGGWDLLSKEDQEEILAKFPNPDEIRQRRQKPTSVPDDDKSGGKDTSANSTVSEETSSSFVAGHKDNSFREFRRLCADIANVPGYLDKTATVRKFITKGSDGESFKGDLLLTIRLLLPGVIKRVYNLQSKQIIKLFSRIFGTNQDEMLESLEQGDVAETIREFFEKSSKVQPSKKSQLTIQEVDAFLEHLAKLTKEEDQSNHFSKIAVKCTSNDLKLIIRLVKHDLRINAGAKHILDAVHEKAYEAFQASRDINSIVSQAGPSNVSKNSALSVDMKILVPILPMLAQPCKSSMEALKKCPNGMYSEIKYDGERVQLHKQGNTFKYFSRSLKPVLPHKVRHFEEHIPQAFPHGHDIVLDSEILMIDTVTGEPLPFGSLGKHKRNEYQNANVCLFVFDCMYYNGKSLLNEGLKERRRVLRQNMKEIPYRIVFSEMEEIHDEKALEEMMTKVFRQGLEGLVLKDIMSPYEPGKRHWLKVKKDYLFDGAMADSADLVVLGAWYGTGQKGGMMSVFLMGCYDEDRDVWCTVTKVHTGHDDSTLARLQKELVMEKISKDPSLVPRWLKCTKTMIPDFVAKDPKDQPVWEITGAELTKNVVHTADGISVRFPRVTRIRDDKDWSTATSLAELKVIFQKSKDTASFSLARSSSTTPESSPSKTTSPAKKRPLPSVDEVPAKRARYSLKRPFADLFVGMKIVPPEFLSPFKQKTIERYFIAYGGEVLDTQHAKKATHKLVENKEEAEGNPKLISIEGFWDCVKKQRPFPASNLRR